MPCRSNNTSKQSYGWRPPAHPLTGLVYCSDCGGKLYCHRYDNGKLKGKFACGNYPQKECASAHRIDADDLLTLVSKTLKSVYDFIQVDNSEFIKAVDCDVMEIGFPKSVLPQLPFKATDCGDGSMMLILDTPIDEQAFQLWRQRIVLTTTAQPATDASAMVATPAGAYAVEHEVAERIRLLNIASMTPMQCMVLLAELQNDLIK